MERSQLPGATLIYLIGIQVLAHIRLLHIRVRLGVVKICYLLDQITHVLIFLFRVALVCYHRNAGIKDCVHLFLQKFLNTSDQQMLQSFDELVYLRICGPKIFDS